MKAILYPRFHKLRSLLASLTLGLLACMSAHAEFPDRTIKIIVPYPPGGTTDLLARSLAPRLSERLKQSVVIENRAGAGGVIGSLVVAKSPADGYTLVFGTIASHAILPILQKPSPYDPVKDFCTGHTGRQHTQCVAGQSGGASEFCGRTAGHGPLQAGYGQLRFNQPGRLTSHER